MKLLPDLGMTDIQYLQQEFVKAFSFESNVNLRITFQRFEEDYVDLEDFTNIFDRDKLKAVVTPILAQVVSTPHVVQQTLKFKRYVSILRCL